MNSSWAGLVLEGQLEALSNISLAGSYFRLVSISRHSASVAQRGPHFAHRSLLL